MYFTQKGLLEVAECHRQCCLHAMLSSARNAVAVYVSDDETLVMSAKLAFAVIFRFLPVRLSTVALCCVLDAFSLSHVLYART